MACQRIPKQKCGYIGFQWTRTKLYNLRESQDKFYIEKKVMTNLDLMKIKIQLKIMIIRGVDFLFALIKKVHERRELF